MGQLENMALFIAVVESGSITKASERLNLAKSAVSKRLQELEQNLGVTLINRTTRSSSLTEAGQRYFKQAQLITDEVAELNAQMTRSQSKLSGHLRVSAPLSFSLHHLTPVIDQFCKRHPELTLELDLSDAKVNLVEDGIDLALRIGELADSSLQAKRITQISHVLCVSPDYVSEHGAPITPDELSQHRLLKYSQQASTSITLTDSAGVVHTPNLTPHVIANNGDVLAQMAIAGHGITLLPRFIAWQAINDGRLSVLLPNYRLNQFGAYVVYPATRYLPQKSRLFIDFLMEYFGDKPYWER
ncbi:LysR family transcriptional regulator [Paraferrimonas haliotis]|uniref:LysR family transcriptional regulator n=1 Tax=Paraferrimonas haliotis TaxID=2013866 RepID=A0AA37WYH7_9GAMM|nr:LysR family transcriptional regulator [Paraferrimonas haliotis]GLS83106.1 LysR family transcriptional regulator [Paraferrimonas haliotis]